MENIDMSEFHVRITDLKTGEVVLERKGSNAVWGLLNYDDDIELFSLSACGIADAIRCLEALDTLKKQIAEELLQHVATEGLLDMLKQKTRKGV